MKVRIEPEHDHSTSLVFRLEPEELRTLRERGLLQVRMRFAQASPMTFEVRTWRESGNSPIRLERDNDLVGLWVSPAALELLETLEGRRNGVFDSLGTGQESLRYGVEIDLKPKRRERNDGVQSA